MATHNEHNHDIQIEGLERIRSTPLKPAVWMTSVLVWATVVALFLRVPTWAGILLSTITAISFLVFLVGYIYLFANDREALRAERWRKPSRSTPREVTDGERPKLGDSNQEYLGARVRDDGSMVEVSTGSGSDRVTQGRS